ncbi:MAG TPA: MFS transporter [bacterium]|nr:MFS transporter [bacterium]
MSPLRTALLGLLTFLLMLPETLPVPVLRGLVVERFSVSDELATLFVVANMIGAMLAAPLVGLHVDRTGRRRRLCVAMLVADAALMQALAHPLDYGTFLALRLVEGAAHMSALTLLMSLGADAAGTRRGRALGMVGSGMTLGVACGAAIGGILGRDDPLRTLHIASLVLGATAVLGALVLPADIARGERHGFADLVRAVRREPRLRAPLLLALLDRFTVGFFTGGFPLMMAGVFGTDAATIGKLLGAFLFPFALLSYPFGRAAERWSRARLVALGSLGYGIAVAAVGIASPTAQWLLMPLCGVSSAIMFVPTLLWLLERAPGIGRSTAIAAFHAAGSLGFLLGPLACARLVAIGGHGHAGYGLAFATAGAIEIGGAVLVVVVDARRHPPGRAAR